MNWKKQQGFAFSEAQRQRLLGDAAAHRFAIPAGCHWRDVMAVSTNIGAALNAAMRGSDADNIQGIARANPELAGVFTVDWNQPAPDNNGPLISNGVVQALVNHFDRVNLSAQSVPNDVLGRAYEYLIKYFADDAGSKAGEFFTPPEVVDILIRILEPQPGEVVYDPDVWLGWNAGAFRRLSARKRASDFCAALSRSGNELAKPTPSRASTRFCTGWKPRFVAAKVPSLRRCLFGTGRSRAERCGDRKFSLFR